MEDSPATLKNALSALWEGLSVALASLDSDAGSHASVRRLAGSLTTQAAALGAPELSELAEAVREADDQDLKRQGQLLLDRLGEMRSASADHQKHLLLLEDNRTVAAALKAYLDRPNYVLHMAETAADGERALAEKPIDVVLLDLILPDRDGRELLVQIRERAATASLPVVVLSAQTGAVARAECLALGASEFIEKPARPETVRNAVAQQLEGARRLKDARKDPLTGLPNRAVLVEAFERARNDEGTLAVAIIDLDGLKGVNDTLGHEAGDKFLTSVAMFIRDSLSSRHTLARWGGDEFAVVAPNTELEEVRRQLEEVLDRLQRDGGPEVDGRPLPMSFCAGVAAAGPSDTYAVVLAEADRVLYRVKRMGVGSVATTADLDSLPEGSASPRVLLVEDDRVTAALVEHRLTRDGFEIHHFLDGSEAFATAERERFDLAILDVKVPGMDGFALLDRLRTMTHFRATPILMLTAMGNEADVVRGLSSGANDYMLKPFSPTELVARVRRLVASRGATGEGDGPRAD